MSERQTAAEQTQQLEDARASLRAFLDKRAEMADGGGYDPEIIYTIGLAAPGVQKVQLKTSDIETLLRATS